MSYEHTQAVEPMPLGKKLEKPKPVAAEWWPVEGRPHIWQNAKGQFKTELPDPASPFGVLKP